MCEARSKHRSAEGRVPEVAQRIVPRPRSFPRSFKTSFRDQGHPYSWGILNPEVPCTGAASRSIKLRQTRLGVVRVRSSQVRSGQVSSGSRIVKYGGVRAGEVS